MYDRLTGEKSWEYFEYGVAREGTWTCDKLCQQKARVLPLIRRMHPNCEILMTYDNSCNHKKSPEDGLDVMNLNVNDAGRGNKKHMRDTEIVHSQDPNLRLFQRMQYGADEGDKSNMRKGARRSGMTLTPPSSARTSSIPSSGSVGLARKGNQPQRRTSEARIRGVACASF
jgi:hypothetical protein